MESKRKKKFLNLPSLDGGKELLKDFIRKNLRYPEEALEKGIEGDVIVRFRVTGKGEVIEPEVINGPGYGCEEEALRLVGMLHYQSVKNRGVRVTTNNKIKIPFRLPKKAKSPELRVSYKPSGTAKTATPPPKPKSSEQTYSYTITIKS